MYNGQKRLYVIKRANAEMYHTGYYSSATPKLYYEAWGKPVVDRMNKWREQELSKPIDMSWMQRYPKYTPEDIEAQRKLFETYRLQNIANGPWVLLPVTLATVQ